MGALQGCVAVGLALATPSCTPRAALFASDRPRCHADPARIKAPRPIQHPRKGSDE